MPRKSKTSSANDDSVTSSSVATPTRPEVHLRRSNRRLPQDTREEDDTREIQGKVLGIRPHGEAAHHKDAEADREETTKEGVLLAIEGLVRMERRLQRATKKQKRKVESTTFSEALDPGPGKEPTPEYFREAELQKAEPVKHSQLRSSSKEAADSKKAEEKYLNDKAGSDDASVDGPEGISDEVERGAARQPPVNSGYLPLPWKGRLGYVGSID